MTEQIFAMEQVSVQPESKLASDVRYYYLASFEEPNGNQSLLDTKLDAAVKRLSDDIGAEKITDVFVLSHGWMSDIPGAKKQYGDWLGQLNERTRDEERLPKQFKPLIIGLHWPSLPWGDENTDGKEDDSEGCVHRAIADFLKNNTVSKTAEKLVIDLQTKAIGNLQPVYLTDDQAKFLETLNNELGLKLRSEPSPNDDRLDFSMSAANEWYQNIVNNSSVFTAIPFKGMLNFLRMFSYWKKKELAWRIGSVPARRLLSKLQLAAPSVRFHLVGHSFGTVLVCGMLCGRPNDGLNVRPATSLSLIQGALSVWAFSGKPEYAAGKQGFYHSLIKDKLVSGSVITTRSAKDYAVGIWYPLAAGISESVTFVKEKPPKYAGLGSFGVLGADLQGIVHDISMEAVGTQYNFKPGHIYNIDSVDVIKNIITPSSGAHCDIAHPEVVHAVLQAATAGSRNG